MIRLGQIERDQRELRANLAEITTRLAVVTSRIAVISALGAIVGSALSRFLFEHLFRGGTP